jgi:hypothetical protein
MKFDLLDKICTKALKTSLKMKVCHVCDTVFRLTAGIQTER